jgi:F-type H+-transporting ATPase subunit gamma
MANLKEIRNRIVSVNSTMQITSAMKMVSAAKLRRAQDAVTRMRPYASKLNAILGNLSGTMAELENRYVEARPVKRVLIIPINSNRGLCGGFNANIIKETNRLLKTQYAECDVEIMTVGKKAYDIFKKGDKLATTPGVNTSAENARVYDDINFNASSAIFERVMQAFWDRKFDEVILVYNSFKNAAVQMVKSERVLPVVAPEASESEIDFIFQPDKTGILETLIPNALKAQFYAALLDSNAAEHGARMTAMHKATDNAKDLLHNLKLTYNKARQAAITTEILEIVGGAEALND